MRLFFVILVCIGISSCNSNKKARIREGKTLTDTLVAARMMFESKNADFGTVLEGEKVILFYTFENAGDADLVIYEAIPSCGCTVPKFDKSPVKPGEKRNVEVTFDSEGWYGTQQKSITFKTNANPNYTTITLTGNVN